MQGFLSLDRPAEGLSERQVAKLTGQQVREIREAEGSISSIAKRYQIARAHVRMTKDRKIWKHVA
jgi:hypothetical protein